MADDEDMVTEIEEALRTLTEEELTQVLLVANTIYEDAIGEDEPTEDPSWTQKLIMRGFMAGYLSGAENAPAPSSTDLLVGISPEDASTIVSGLLGDGATLTLSVIRQG